jgi:SAM-dependent methyltransferase
MLGDVVRLTRCMACGTCLVREQEGLTCSGCGRRFPEVRGVLRFVDSGSYADSFGYQWQAFDRTQLNPPASEWDFVKKTGLRPAELKDKLVLDVGCGMGRFAEVATRWGARVVGIDLSSAAEVAARNLADREFIALQADVFALPFAPESFDVIYSVGVLHHTPDCERAFKVLPQFLKPGGKIAVWLYSGYNNWHRFSDQYRKVTHRMSPRTLHRVFSFAVPSLYRLDQGLRVIPILGKPMAGMLALLFPISKNRDPQVRLLDTLDWYSPKYQSKHTYEQVFRWFESCGLEHLTVADISIGVKGAKPLQEGGKRAESETLDSAALITNRRQTEAHKPPPKLLRMARRASITLRWLPAYAMQRVSRSVPRGRVHLVIAMADHFEPAIVPGKGNARANYGEQERRVYDWCREYPLVVDGFRDGDGHPFKHTYFYPAEQYDPCFVEQLAQHCHSGWGEIEIHLHHGRNAPDTEANTRRQLKEFCEILASKHKSLSFMDGDRDQPRYAFVHGNYALANSAGGRFCGVDSELQILSETGCYADLTLPPGSFHPAQISKINSLYECELPLNRRAAHRQGHDLECGRPPTVFPIIILGPLMLDFAPWGRSRLLRIENAGITGSYAMSVARLNVWKRARICVKGRPEWLFIKLHCHGMDPREKDAVMGEAMRHFLRELVEGAGDRKEILHFVSAREMMNIILAACDGREGNPGDYRDYRLKWNDGSFEAKHDRMSQMALKN